MQHVLHIECPPELLCLLRMTTEEMSDWTKVQAASSAKESNATSRTHPRHGQHLRKKSTFPKAGEQMTHERRCVIAKR